MARRATLRTTDGLPDVPDASAGAVAISALTMAVVAQRKATPGLALLQRQQPGYGIEGRSISEARMDQVGF